MENANDKPIDNELDWLAYQYVAGEFSHAERDSFEERLAIDQAAREAVAAAVELSSACRAAFAADSVRPAHVVSRRSTPSGQSTRQTARRLAVLAAALAACIAIAWLGRFRDGGSDPGLADRDATDRGASAVGSESLWGTSGPQRLGRVQQLALAWADLGEQLSPDEPRDAAANGAGDPPDINSAAPTSAASHDEDLEVAAPDWLMAALDDDTNPDADRDEG